MSGLETALLYADAKSLKALARQEERRADRYRNMLAAVLRQTGPVLLPPGAEAVPSGFTLRYQDDGVAVSAGPLL